MAETRLCCMTTEDKMDFKLKKTLNLRTIFKLSCSDMTYKKYKIKNMLLL